MGRTLKIRARSSRFALLLCVALAMLVAPAAATASPSGWPSPPAPSVSIGPGPVPPAGSVDSHSGALTVQPANSDTALCLTGPGVDCYVDFLMSKGIASVIFYFSDGTDAQGAKSCYQATCSMQAIGFPNSPTREAVSVYVTGPNISIFATGPYYG